MNKEKQQNNPKNNKGLGTENHKSNFCSIPYYKVLIIVITCLAGLSLALVYVVSSAYKNCQFCINDISLSKLEDNLQGKLDECINLRGNHPDAVDCECSSTSAKDTEVVKKYNIILMAYKIQQKLLNDTEISREIDAIKELIKDRSPYEKLILEKYADSSSKVGVAVILKHIKDIIDSNYYLEVEAPAQKNETFYKNIKDSFHNLLKIRKHGESARAKHDLELLKHILIKLKNNDISGVYYDQNGLSQDTEEINKLKEEIKELFFVYDACAKIITNLLNEE